MEIFKMLKGFFGLMFADTSLNVHTTSDLDVFIPEHWDTKIRLDAERKSFWDKMEGSEGSNMPIIRRDDFTAKAGDLVHVQVVSNLEAAGVSGETELKGKEEKLEFGQFDLKVEWLRHAVGFNKRGTKRALLDAIKVANNSLSTWLAKTKDDDVFAQLLGLSAQRRIATAESADITILYPNAVSAVASLTNADTFGTDEITKAKIALGRKLAEPIRTMMDGKQEVEFFGLVLDDISAEYYLKNDSVWQQTQREAGLRSDSNRLFTGAFGSFNSVVIYSFKGRVGEGSFLRPEFISTAQSLANAEISLGVTGDRKPYQQYFVDGATKYIATEPDGTENAVTMDGGKTITASIANETEIAKHYRLEAHTHAQLEAGTIFTQENHYATAIAFGAEISARVWGMYPKPITEVRDYGFQNGVGIECVYGNKVIENHDEVAPNFVLLRHYSKSPFVGSGL